MDDELEVRFFEEMPSTRPCTFCLSLNGDSVFADFDALENRVLLARISFDGFGCCETRARIRAMDDDDARALLAMRRDNLIDVESAGALLRRYFRQNVDVIWEDALRHHGLLVNSHA